MQQNVMKKETIIIGAGVSGLMVANGLKTAGSSVGILEKARGTGGRISSKRLALNSSGQFLSYDLGASGFHAVTESFQDYLTGLEQQNIVCKFNNKYAGIPRNSSVTRYLSADLDIHFSQKVSRIEHDGPDWIGFGNALDSQKAQAGQSQSELEIPLAVCKRIIFSAPAEQTQALLPVTHSALHWLKAIKSQVTFVTTFVLDNALNEQDLNTLQAHLLMGKTLKEVSFEHLKPHRECGAHIVIKLSSSHAWAQTHKNTEFEVVTEIFKRLLLIELNKINHTKHRFIKEHTHRWLYSQYDQCIAQSKGYLSFDDGISIVGDYFDIEGEALKAGCDTQHMGGVERSFLSAQHLLNKLHSSEAAIKQKSQVENIKAVS